MTKPSIAELLNAAGHTTYTEPLVMQAMYTLYGNIGVQLGRTRLGRHHAEQQSAESC